MMNVNIHSPLYNFLVEPRFRWFRHIILILFMGIVILNDAFGVYKGRIGVVNLYAILFFFTLVYLLFTYLNIYWSIPKLLLNKKYVQYFLVLSGTSLFLSIGHIFAEYCIHKYYKIPFGNFSFFSDGRDPIIGLSYSYFLIIFYLTSISSVVFYKYWMLNIKKVEQLKAEQFNSELNNLKNRISPDFLFDKLNRAAGYCLIRPSYTSHILLQLSRILRYQLYDCSRERVLLNSEIKYLNDYLTLEKVCNDRFDFKIIHPRLTINYLIPPLLLISLVEDSLRKLIGRNDCIWINIEFSITGDILTFNITDNRSISDIPEDRDNHLLIQKQLEPIQNKEYSLSSKPDKYLNQYKTVFQYRL